MQAKTSVLLDFDIANLPLSVVENLSEALLDFNKKDGWTVTHDPLTLEFGLGSLYMDFILAICVSLQILLLAKKFGESKIV